MADPIGFILPTTEDFDTFLSLDPAADSSDYTDPQKTWMVRTAADLMLLATGMDKGSPVPEMDSPLGRMIKNGILDMAFYLGSSFDDRASQQFSPFASENLGQYSYSRFITAITNKHGTGVGLFDQAVDFYTSQQSGDADTGQFASSSEDVFKTNFRDYEDKVRTDSQYTWGWR